MQYREFLKSKLKGHVPRDVPLPSGFHLIGHVALLSLNQDSLSYADKIGELTLEYDKRIRSVAIRTGPTEGQTRRPDYTLVAGDSNTVTTHVEQGVRFRVDPLQLTFSGGNRAERIRMGNIVKPGERVVDMFACVGQFSLHAARTGGAEVVAIEINPIAYEYLIENIELNGLCERVKAILGDCREVHPIQFADRVILGYLHDTQDYLEYALEALVPRDGIVHMHSTLPEREMSEAVIRTKAICSDYGFSSEISARRVKMYSPNIYHFVFDIAVTQT
ncbi:MAG: class I SAM-dependent methyltransferase family protein [Candidatus Thorarchaeota archaeon]